MKHATSRNSARDILASPQKAAARQRNAARKKSPARPRRSRRPKEPSFGDLCERSEGLAVVWRRNGCTEREMREFADDDPFVLCDVVPALHALGFAEEEVIRHVPHDGILAALMLGLSRLATANGVYGRGSGVLALPPWILVAFFRRAVTRRIAALRNKAARGVHYEAEKARRRAMAAERRRVTRRVTTSPCPTREAVLDAWRHVRDSKESLVRFGSMMQDLECYVDNSLRLDGSGRIVGRNAGVKGWLRENVPELAERYCSVIRYKAAAKKLRQVVGLADPTPVAAVLGDGHGGSSGAEAAGVTESAGDECNHGAEKSHGGRMAPRDGTGNDAATEADKDVCRRDGRWRNSRAGDGARGGGESPPVEVVRARAVYLEAMDGVPDVAARVMARIDALCDPERTDESATLRSWREKYVRAITVRRKDSWWRRLTA